MKSIKTFVLGIIKTRRSLDSGKFSAKTVTHQPGFGTRPGVCKVDVLPTAPFKVGLVDLVTKFGQVTNIVK